MVSYHRFSWITATGQWRKFDAPRSTVALISSDIEVFPKSSIRKIQLSYYRSPLTPSYQVFLSGSGVEVFNPSASQDFELPYHYEQDLVYEIAKMIGLNIRDQQVEIFGRTEDNQS